MNVGRVLKNWFVLLKSKIYLFLHILCQKCHVIVKIDGCDAYSLLELMKIRCTRICAEKPGIEQTDFNHHVRHQS